MNVKDLMVERLLNGEIVENYREGGNSMSPRIKHRQAVNIYPFNDGSEPEVNDVVFCKVRGRYMMHLLTAIDGERYQISNNHGHVNGWTTRDKIYGLVEPA